jgi:hypothetical protein
MKLSEIGKEAPAQCDRRALSRNRGLDQSINESYALDNSAEEELQINE